MRFIRLAPLDGRVRILLLALVVAFGCTAGADGATVRVKAAGRGAPWFTLADGLDAPTTIAGDGAAKAR